MKKYLVLMFIAISLFACKSDPKVEELQAKNDSLISLANDRDRTINELFESFNQIEENLQVIKDKEKIVSDKSSVEGEVNADAKERINEDILSMYELMLKNKRELQNLRTKMRQANVKMAEFEKMVTNLNKSIAQKDEEIGALKQKLEQMNLTVSNLNSRIDSISKVEKAKAEASEQVIQEKTTVINTAYYAIGTKKELLEKKIIVKAGGLINRDFKLADNFDKSYFTKVDISKDMNIQVMSKKAKIITNHPSTSYKINGSKDKFDSIDITNAEEFWSVSKYLVILVE